MTVKVTGSSGPMPSARHIRVQVIITHYKLYNKLEGPCVMLIQRFQKKLKREFTSLGGSTHLIFKCQNKAAWPYHDS